MLLSDISKVITGYKSLVGLDCNFTGADVTDYRESPYVKGVLSHENDDRG
jgi:hypothetical protein